MTPRTSQRMKGLYSSSGLKSNQETGTPLYSDFETTCLRQQAALSAGKAREAARRAGVRMHPRVAALKAKVEA